MKQRVDKRNTHPPWRAFRRQLTRLLKHSMRLKVQHNELPEAVFERRERGARTHAIPLSLFRTAELRGQHPVTFVITLVKAAINGHVTQLDDIEPLKRAA